MLDCALKSQVYRLQLSSEELLILTRTHFTRAEPVAAWDSIVRSDSVLMQTPEYSDRGGGESAMIFDFPHDSS